MLIGLCGGASAEFVSAAGDAEVFTADDAEVFTADDAQVFTEDDYISHITVNSPDSGAFRTVPDAIPSAPDDATFSVMALSDARSDSVSLLSASSDCTYTVNTSINFGVSGSQYSVVGIGSYAGTRTGNTIVARYYPSPATTGNYLKATGLVVDCEWDVDASYPDVDSIDFYGKAWAVLYCSDDQGNWLYKKAQNVQILVNGAVFGPVLKLGDTVDYTYTLSKGETVTSVGLRCTYGDVFDLMATAEPSGLRNCILSVSNGSSTVTNTNVNTSQTGFFNSILRWLADIRDGITSVVNNIKSGFSNVVNAITSLPQKIADAIKSLFVPSDEQLEELRTSFNNLLETKLGFVYQAGSLVDGVFDAIFDAVDNPNYDASFTIPAFPAFQAGGADVQLWDTDLTVDFSDNQFVTTAQNIAYPFVIALMVWAFVHSMEDAFLAFVGGKSLIDWIRNREGRKEE